MSNQNAVLSWRNWVFEVAETGVGTGSFETEAPVSALATPQLGDLAIAASSAVNWYHDFGQGVGSFRPVHVVALLNTNIVTIGEVSSAGSGGLSLDFTDDDGNTGDITVPSIVVPSAANDFQSHLIYFVPESGLTFNRDEVRRLTIAVDTDSGLICGSIDPYTGDITEEAFSCGGIWAGPVWRPPYGVRFRSLVQSVIEERRGPTSLGRQRYPSVEAKQRSEQLELLLPESAAVGLDPAVGSVQQLASWCGVSRPLLCIPTDTSADLIYASGLYGYLDEPVAWTHVDQSNADGSLKRYHAATLQVTEAL